MIFVSVFWLVFCMCADRYGFVGAGLVFGGVGFIVWAVETV